MTHHPADPLLAHLRRCCLRVMGKKPGCGFFVAPQLLITCSHVVGHAVPVGTMVQLNSWDTVGAPAVADGVESGLPLQAEVLANNTTVDLALLRLAAGGHPHVALDGEVRVDDPLVAIGFPQEAQRLELDQFTAEFEADVPFADASGQGPSGVELKFKGGNVRPGFSGGPLLNRRTWRVIGVVAVTRDARSLMGGFAKPLACIEALLGEAGQAMAPLDPRWTDAEARQRQLAEGAALSFTPEQLRQIVQGTESLDKHEPTELSQGGTAQLQKEGLLAHRLNEIKREIAIGNLSVAFSALATFLKDKDSSFLARLNDVQAIYEDNEKRSPVISREEYDQRIEEITTTLFSLTKDVRQTYRLEGPMAGRIRIAGDFPSNIITNFKNRFQVRRKLYLYLNNPDVRFVSIEGRGGIGKTALAVQIIDELRHDILPLPSGLAQLQGIVYLSNGRAHIDVGRFFAALAELFPKEMDSNKIRKIGYDEIRSAAEKVKLVNELAEGRSYLILLDQVEEMLTEQRQFRDQSFEELVSQIIKYSPHLRIVCTTRCPPRLSSELRKFLRTIPLIEGVPTRDGVLLLRELDSTTVNMRLSTRTDEELAELVNLAHGVPRALELLSAIIDQSPTFLLKCREQRRMGFYNFQDVMDDLVSQAYSLQDEGSQRVLEILSVFRVTVNLNAIKQIISSLGLAIDVDSSVDSLSVRHIVKFDASGMVSLHPIDMEYAYRCIPSDGSYSLSAVERAVASYYGQLYSFHQESNIVEGTDALFSRIEHMNNAGDFMDAFNIINDVGMWIVWQGCARRLLALAEVFRHHLCDRRWEASLNRILGNCYTVLGPYDKAVAHFEAALSNARDLGLITEIEIDYGVCLRYKGDPQEAKERFLNALKSLDKQSRYSRSIVLRQLGRVSIYLGALDDGVKYSKEALELDMSLGADNLIIGNDKSMLALALTMQHNLPKAREIALSARIALTRSHETDTLGYVLNNLGLIELYRGNHMKSIYYLKKSVEFGSVHLQPRNEAFAQFNLSFVYFAERNIAKAHSVIQKAVTILSALNAGELCSAQQFMSFLEQCKSDIDYRVNGDSLQVCFKGVDKHPDLVNLSLLPRSC